MLGTTIDAKSEPRALASRGIPFLLEGYAVHYGHVRRLARDANDGSCWFARVC